MSRIMGVSASRPRQRLALSSSTTPAAGAGRLALPNRTFLRAIHCGDVSATRGFVGDHVQILVGGGYVIPGAVGEIHDRLAAVIHGHHAADQPLETLLLFMTRLHADEFVRPRGSELLGFIEGGESHGETSKPGFCSGN